MSVSPTTQISPGMQVFFGRIFPLPFIIIGAVAFFFGCRNLLQASQSRTWPTAQGVIRDSSVEHQRGNKGGTYLAKVMYDFTVNATTFNGKRVAFGDYSSGNSSLARDIVDRYPKGKTVAVYYNQKNPQVCVLEPGIKGQTWLLPVFGLIFLAAGSITAVVISKAIKLQAADELCTQGDKAEGQKNLAMEIQNRLNLYRNREK